MSKVRLLRCHWASFALLVMLGQVTKLLFMPYSSPGKTILGAKPFTGNAAFFTLLVVVTYLNRKFLWGLAGVVSSVPLSFQPFQRLAILKTKHPL